MKTQILLTFFVLGGALGCVDSNQIKKVPFCSGGCACMDASSYAAGCMPDPIVPHEAKPIPKLNRLQFDRNGGGDLHFYVQKDSNSLAKAYLVTTTRVNFAELSQPEVIHLCSKKENEDYNSPDFNLCRYLDWLFDGELYYLIEDSHVHDGPIMPTGTWANVRLEPAEENPTTGPASLSLDITRIYSDYNTLNIFDLLEIKVRGYLRDKFLVLETQNAPNPNN